MLKNKSIIIRAIMLVVMSVIIVFFMPREKRFTYDYSVGAPWRYSQIIAEYAFPIYKSDAKLKAEQDSAIREMRPIFIYNPVSGNEQIKNFSNKLADDAIPHAPLLVEILEKVYQQGVVDQEVYKQYADSVDEITVSQGNDARVLSVKSVFSPLTAYQYVSAKADSIGLPKSMVSSSHVSDYIIPNLILDSKRTESVRNDALQGISPTYDMVQNGEKIIDRGEIVTERTYEMLKSLELEKDRRGGTNNNSWWMMLGQFVCVFILLGVFLAYLYLYRTDYAESFKSVAFLFSLIMIFTIAASYAMLPTELNIYVVPFAIVTIFVRVFMDSRTAFSAMLIIICICSLSLHNPYEFMLLETVAGLTAIYSLKELTSRSQLIRSVTYVTIITALIKLGYDLSQGFIISTINPSWYVRIAINGVLLLFAYPLMLLFEKLFGFVSSVTLVELSNVNTPLLRQMSKEAQGTFNHSMQVANLASEVASKIGANVQLVRTAALYHDIGKLKNPAFFTENQSGFNPHDNLTETQSAQIITHHISDGLEMADKHRLPNVIKECIATHHGCGKARFFYINYMKNHPDEPINEELFAYPGPNPQTKEQAILMMADSVEAASRSLKEVNEENLRSLVDNIVDQQVKEGYFEDCPITFHDIFIAKAVLVSSLRTIYHTRISYPTMEEPKSSDVTVSTTSLDESKTTSAKSDEPVVEKQNEHVSLKNNELETTPEIHLETPTKVANETPQVSGNVLKQEIAIDEKNAVDKP